MVTEVKKAIRTDAAWAADQAAMEALYGVGGYYTTLSAWEAAQQGDLVTANEIRTAVCYNDWPTGLVDKVEIAGSTTNSTRFLKIAVAAGHRHTGTPQTGFHIKYATTAYTSVFRVNNLYVYVDGIDVENMAAVNGAYGIHGQVQYCYISNCIAKTTTNALAAAFLIGSYNSTYRNLLAWGGNVGFTSLNRNNPNENLVAANCITGILGGGSTFLLKNSVAYNNTTNYSGSFDTTNSTCNASSSASGAPGTNPVHNVTSAAFVNAAANNFHLASGSALIGAGVNLYSTFTTDIDGDTWPATGAWDIGFDYYVAAGPIIPILSLPGVDQITTTGARPYVSLGF